MLKKSDSRPNEYAPVMSKWRFSNAFNMGEVVTYKDVDYIVFGIHNHLGYNTCLYEYDLVKPVNGTVVKEDLFRYGDVTMVTKVKEHEIFRLLQGNEAKLVRLNAQQEALRAEIERIENLKKTV